MNKATILMPVKIDSPSRLFNVNSSLEFLLKYYNFDIIVKQVGEQPHEFIKHKSIKHIFEFESNSMVFYKTKILNDMLEMVETKYAITYDCDMLIPTKSTNKSIELLEQGNDLVFPYKRGYAVYDLGINYTHMPKLLNDTNNEYLDYLLKKYERDGDEIIKRNGPGVKQFQNIGYPNIWTTGGIRFFNTESYKKAFGENEDFIGWGPEDMELLYRFIILGMKVAWSDDCRVCHMAHDVCNTRKDKDVNYVNNHNKWDYITQNIKNKKEMLDYIHSLDYTKKRKFG